MKFVIGRTLTILSWDNPVTAFFRKSRKLRHSLGRPSRSDFVHFEVYAEPVLKLNHITDGDLVSMIGNLVDNALEATIQCESEKKKISLRIFMEQEGRVCVVKLMNYFVTPPVFEKSGFITNKKNKEMHGIGIKSVKKTAGKYGGYLQCLVDNDKFSAILILPVKG